MSEFAPAAVSANAAVNRGEEALRVRQVEDILGEFRAWLLQSATVASSTPPVGEPPDLHALLGQMTALRQEVNLQTRAARAQQEQNAEALRHLAEALQALQQHEQAAQEQTEQERAESLRPLLKTFLDLHDALSLAKREVQKVHDSLTSALAALPAGLAEEHAPSPPPETSPSRRRSLWQHLFGGAADPRTEAAHLAMIRSLEELVARQGEQLQSQRQTLDAVRIAAERVRQYFESVVTGYTMSLQRLERALEQHGLEAISCLGESFDPETMEAVEVESEPGRIATEVVAEVRRGYFWRGRVFRFAQVKVARPCRR